MNPTSIVLRWYRQSTSAALPGQYTAEEVLQLLRSTDRTDTNPLDVEDDLHERRTERANAVRQVATRPATWLGELTKQQRQEIGELADRLPSLLFHHAIGGGPDELLERWGGWSTWRYERAREVAGACIASHLNGARLVA